MGVDYCLTATDPMRIVDRAWPLLRRLMGGHTAVYRATGGRVGHKFPGSPPMLLLDHVGAKSGQRRTIPLVYVKDGENLVLVASKGGNPKNPAWFHNLRATRRRPCRSAQRSAGCRRT